MTAPIRQEVDGFVVEPFDALRSLRHEAVTAGLEAAFAPARVFLRTSDDDYPESNWIREEVFTKLLASHLVVVDTFPVDGEPFGRPNVYLELGYCLAVGKPVVLIESNEKNKHSDLQGFLAVRLDPQAPAEQRLADLKGELRELGPRLTFLALQAELRWNQPSLLLHLGRHLEVRAGFGAREWKGVLTQGAGKTGLRILMESPDPLPSSLILEVRRVNGSSEDPVAIATGWIQTGSNTFQADVLAGAALPLVRMLQEGSGVSRVKLISWDGLLHDYR